MNRRLLQVLLILLACAEPACLRGARSTLPEALTSQEFWSLSTELSEPPGAFTHSDNLVSNERQFVQLARILGEAGGAYIGVGPEQNFSYIAAVRPEIAFVVDIRRENLDLHLLYKALFEVSHDRADFVSRLFSRERPAGLGPRTSVANLFEAYDRVRPSQQVFDATTRLVRERLVDAHGFPLTPRDLEWIDYALRAFFSDGPAIHYARQQPADTPGPSYRTLMTIADIGGESRSYLSTEARYAFVKHLQETNRIVPVVGDFGSRGPLVRIGSYLRGHSALVRAFYGSNVEVYLTREKMLVYCRNLAELPYSSRTSHINSRTVQPLVTKLQSCGTRDKEAGAR